MQTRKMKGIEDGAAWHSGDKFYELLFLYYQDMLDARKAKDIDGMLNTFDEIIILVYPYIENVSTKEDRAILEDNNSILEKYEDFKNENTDSEIKHNYDIMNVMIRELNVKRKLLSKLMAKAKLHLPLRKKDSISAALSDDDYIIGENDDSD